MSTFLVPLDGSYHAEQALGPALSLVRPSDELALLRVVAEAELAESALAESYLRELVVRLREGGLQAAVRILVRAGHPETEILQAARIHADHVILCSHRRDGWLRLLQHSVAESLLRQVPCPLWLVPAAECPSAYGPGWEGLGLAPQRILVPLDGSQLDERTMAFLQTWPWPRKAVLILLAAVDAPIPLSGPPPPSLRSYLAQRARLLSAEGWTCEERVSENRPLGALLEEPADLLVLSIHRSHGEIAEKLGRRCSHPVIFLPH